jgi:murein DD-endopeptidase MepM/ murein hydrolase activator NlpD
MLQPTCRAFSPDGPDVDGRRSRALIVALAVVAISLSTAVGGARAVVQNGATADTPAERVLPEPAGGRLMFPINPVPRCDIADSFGGESKSGQPGGHQGVDIGADEWQEVYAVESGVLERRLDDLDVAAGLGWVLLGDSQTQFRYYHLAGFADDLAVGDRVERGDLIGYVGSTGNAHPTGWHLHFEIRPGPQPKRGAATSVDPLPLLEIPDNCRIY